MTSYDLEQLGKLAAKSFIESEVPLQESLVKIASENALNRQQLNRVVEKANANVHLHLYNNSSGEEKYPEFDTANADHIYEVVHGPQEKTAHLSDYEQDPEIHTSYLDKYAEVNIFGVDTEEPRTKTTSEYKNEFYKIAATIGRIQERLEEKSQEFFFESAKLYDLTKQAFLQGNKFGDIYKAACSQDNEFGLIDRVFTGFQNELSKEMPVRKDEFTKTSNVTYTVNSNHPIVQQVHRLTKVASDYISLSTKEKEAFEDLQQLEKESSAVFRGLGNLVKAITPRGAVIPGAVGVGAGAGVTRSAMKEKRRQEQSPIRQVPDRYRRTAI